MQKSEILEKVKLIIEDNNDPLSEICKILNENFPHYDWVGFYLVNPEKENELILGPYVGEPTDHTNIPFGKGICGQVAESKKTFVIQDVSKETNYLSCSNHVKSEIVIPILKDGNFVAQLDIDSHKLDTFSDEDIKFLEKICEMLISVF